MSKPVVSEKFTNYQNTIDRLLETAGIAKVLRDGRPVMLKPNLVNASPFPVTTPPKFCEAVISFIRKHTDVPIVIAEGCGDAYLETAEVFARLGYQALSKRLNVDLVDLNHEALVRVTDASCKIFKEMWLPETVFDHVLISLPVLKAHSLCRFTGSMKNMLGLAPPKHYSDQFGTWKKAAFHNRLDQAIVDLNRYRSPDFTIMDATVGLVDYHLGGAICKPPVNRILAGTDARLVDREASGLIGLDWQSIPYLQ